MVLLSLGLYYGFILLLISHTSRIFFNFFKDLGYKTKTKKIKQKLKIKIKMGRMDA